MEARKSSSPRYGFALIVALALMAFVTLLLVTLTTFTRIECEVSSVRSEQTQARANALMGLSVALGNLQEAAGPDQRVTGTAELLGDVALDSQRYWTGVWNTSGHNYRGAYVEPDLVAWLVSGVSAGGASPAPGTVVEDSVTMLSDPDLADNDVVAGRVEIRSPGSDEASGHYAYWIADEGVKAKVSLNDPYRESDSDLQRRFSLMTAQRFGVEGITLDESGMKIGEVIDLFDEATQDKLARLATKDQSRLVADGLAGLGGSRFHDVTTASYGLLSDVKNGGLREDLSLAFEMDLDDFNQVDEFAAGGELIPSGTGSRVNYLFTFDDFGVDGPVIDDPMARGPTWLLLRNYYRLYKSNDPDRMKAYKPGNPAGVQKDGTGYSITARPSFPQLENADGVTNGLAEAYYRVDEDPTVNDTFDGNGATPIPRPTDMEILPVLLRMQAFLSVQAVEKTPASEGVAATYSINLQIDPVITIWNPYNVALTFDEFQVEWLYFDLGMTTTVTEPGGSPVTYDTFLSGLGVSKTNGGRIETNVRMLLRSASDGSVTLAPGQTQVFTFNRDISNSNSYVAVMHPYNSTANNPRVNKGFEFPDIVADAGSDTRTALIVPDGSEISFSVKSTDQNFNLATKLVRKLGTATETIRTMSGGLTVPSTSDTFAWPSSNPGDYKLVGQILDTVQPLKHPLGVIDIHLKPAYSSSPVQFLAHYNPRAPSFRRSTGAGIYGGEETPMAGNWYFGLGALTGWDTGDLAIDTNGGGYWGWSNSAGASRLVLYEIPTLPLQSLATFQHVNNVTYYAQQPGSPIASAYANPFIPRTALSRTIRDSGKGYTQIDWSYLANDALWDKYFFSTLGPRLDTSPEQDDFSEILGAFLSGVQPLPNSRMHLYLSSDESAGDVTGKLVDTGTSSDIAPSAYARSAENLLVDGAFNINSTSVEAWKALLTSANGLDVDYITADNSRATANGQDSVFSRMSLPGGRSDTSSVADRWTGFRTLDEGEVEDLAEAIVEQVKERGPFVSLSDFVNRRLANDDTGLKGTLQAAIDETRLNNDFAQTVTTADLTPSNISYLQHAVGKAAAGAPGYLSQSDLLMSLAPVLSARSDTFVIRAYGDSSNPLTGQTSRAWCEAVVQRLPEYVDDGNEPQASGDALNAVNRLLGRRFEIVSFRWLDTNEI